MTQDLHTMAPEATSRLRANVCETAGGETYVLEIPVPGLSQEEIVIEVEPDTVTVRTEPRKDEAAAAARRRVIRVGQGE